ncbi:UNVERIFIED_CONTAM: AP-1 complex subunit mu-2 [Sesamum radiatum]|uniref:AP-1 complex subunit mu-2 n=1 Tax=Sesamum radiatum TaxID=300843 RepID=A0AAW2JTP8_SESRA
MPECKLGLNDRVLLEAQGRATKGKAIDLDDIKFHQGSYLYRLLVIGSGVCGWLDLRMTGQYPSYLLMDSFDLMTYRLALSYGSFQVKPLIWVEAQVERHSRSRIEIMLKARSQFKERSTATNVEIELPRAQLMLPIQCSYINGVCCLCRAKRCINMEIKSFPGWRRPRPLRTPARIPRAPVTARPPPNPPPLPAPPPAHTDLCQHEPSPGAFHRHCAARRTSDINSRESVPSRARERLLVLRADAAAPGTARATARTRYALDPSDSPPKQPVRSRLANRQRSRSCSHRGFRSGLSTIPSDCAAAEGSARISETRTYAQRHRRDAQDAP